MDSWSNYTSPTERSKVLFKFRTPHESHSRGMQRFLSQFSITGLSMPGPEKREAWKSVYDGICYHPNVPGTQTYNPKNCLQTTIDEGFQLWQEKLVALLQKARHIDIPTDNASAAAENTSPLDTLDSLIRTLSDHSKQREANAFRIAQDQCLESKTHGGLGLNLADENSSGDIDALHQTVLFQVEVWLEALNSEDRAKVLRSGLTSKPAGRRPMTLSEKILAHHAVTVLPAQGPTVGDTVRVCVDWVISSELAWAGLYAGISKAGVRQVFRNDRIWIAGDHRVDPRNYKTALSQKLIGAATKAQQSFKLTDYKGANYTIMHTEFVRQKAEPGSLVIGADSRNLAIGLGIADVAIPVITGETWLKIPECINIRFTGTLLAGIGGKDVILHILKELKRNTVAASRIVEFTGPGLKYLSIDARFAICNMCTEFGAITGICEPDEVTLAYIQSRRGRAIPSSPFYFRSDDDAEYAQVFEIDLGNVKPSVALYPSPDNVVPITEVTGTRLDGCFIGACTTTEEDLVLAGLVLKVGLANGLPLSAGTRHVTPGSLPIVDRLQKLGLLDVYESAGFTRGAPGCSYCVGVVDVAASGSVWLSSQNRNFQDRMGKGAIGHLASATAVAASSFAMKITDPSVLLRDIDQDVWSKYKEMIKGSNSSGRGQIGTAKLTHTEPDFLQSSVQTPKAPLSSQNGSPTSNKMPDINSKAIVLGDYVDTDALAPSEYLTSALTDEALADHCMEYTYPDFRDKVRKGQQILVAGKAFGVGSSREMAPRALKGLGVQCVIARSFAFIYARNQPNIGLLGIVIDDDKFHALATNGTEIEVKVALREVCVGGKVFGFKLDDMELALIENGGMAPAFARFGKDVFEKLNAESGRYTNGVPLKEESWGGGPKELQW
ncbi:MAG: hypothetical protein Q9213_004593 [Squamulea squamosa]